MFEKSSVVLLNFTLKFNNGNKEKSIIGKVVVLLKMLMMSQCLTIDFSL